MDPEEKTIKHLRLRKFVVEAVTYSQLDGWQVTAFFYEIPSINYSL